MPRTAILLINLGTPDAPTPSAVSRYLMEFLSDPYVIHASAYLNRTKGQHELPVTRVEQIGKRIGAGGARLFKWLWPLILRCILPVRARSSAAKYAAIWQPKGSPLRIYTQQQVEALKMRLASLPCNNSNSRCDWIIEYAMRYGEPSIPTLFAKLAQAGVNRVLLISMYPQYSISTTASAFELAFAELKKMRNPPEVHTVEHYADFPAYIAALAACVREYWALHGQPDFAAGDRLLLSFHGLPQRIVDLGDPYYQQCQTTGKLLTLALGLSKTECQIVFQSRFGPARWLQPYLMPTLKAWGSKGVRRIDVFCAGFTADCLETLHEVEIEARSVFLRAGGREYHRIPCLNATGQFIDCLVELIKLNLEQFSVGCHTKQPRRQYKAYGERAATPWQSK